MAADRTQAETVQTTLPRRALTGATAYQPLVTVLFALGSGIVFDRSKLFSFGFYSTILWWLLSIGILAAWAGLQFHLYKKSRIGSDLLLVKSHERKEKLLPWLLLAAVFFSGSAWQHARWNLFDEQEIGRFADATTRPTCVELIARHSPRYSPALEKSPFQAVATGERSRLRVTVQAIRVGKTWEPATGRALLRVDGILKEVQAGDRLLVYCQMSSPRPARNPGEFDFENHARADRRLTELFAEAPECITILDHKPTRYTHYFQRVTDQFRTFEENLLTKHIGPKHSRLAAAILLGSRAGVPRRKSKNYMMTGTIHLLVVSGLHVGILASGVFILLWFGIVPRNVALMAAAGLVVAYAMIADARPPVLRATVLTVLVCLAMATGRRVIAYNSLALAALVVLCVNPGDLFRTGPQLSFLSVATLIWYSNCFVLQKTQDPLDRLIQDSRPLHVRALYKVGSWALHIALATLATWLTSMPLVLHQFHVFAPITVPISPLVWPTVWLALFAGFLLMLFGWVGAWIGGTLGYLCNAGLSGLEWLVNTSQKIPGGHSWWPGPDTWWLVGFYGMLAFYIFGGFRSLWKTERQIVWPIGILALWVAIGFIPPLWRSYTRDSTTCTFVSVGHGTCVVIQTPSGKTLLYDAGTLGAPHQGAQTIASFLWSEGITTIDGIILSHADIDHYNAVPDLLSMFTVRRVFVTPVMFEPTLTSNSKAAPEYLKQTFLDTKVPLLKISAGDRLNTGDPNLRLEVLHPTKEGVLGSDNANSAVLLLEFEGYKVLLPGDLEAPGMNDLLAELPIDTDIVLAPHHGSFRSDPPGFARWSTPEWVVVSGDKRDVIEQVITAYKNEGSRVLSTAAAGAIQFDISHQGADSVLRYRDWFSGWIAHRIATKHDKVE